jgi:TRAP-type C4-dicarboxylate transport system permease small subunit
MNKFLKFLAIVLAFVIGIAGVMQLQLIAFELMNEADTFSFFLGLFYLAIVIFIWGSLIYLVVDYLKNLTQKKESVEPESEQEVNNNNLNNN